DQRGDLVHRIDVRLDLQHRRTDVNVHPADAQVLEVSIRLEHALGPLDVDAVLGFLLPGRRLHVRLGIDFGVDADRADRLLPDRAGDAIDVLDLLFALEVERGNARVDAVGDFLIGLPDAGVDHLLR